MIESLTKNGSEVRNANKIQMAYALVWVYTLTIFLSASLLFLVQPMFGRMVLPMLGGSPAVWNTTMVFYQGILLLGYAYAHFSTRWLGVRKQAIVHLALMLVPLLLLPIAVPPGWVPPSSDNPAPWLLHLLVVAVGLPFFVVSASSPLLQRWFAATNHPAASDPYFLYAASNAGSLLALLSYPFVLEPRMRLMEQSILWRNFYFALIVLTLGCAILVWKAAGLNTRSLSDTQENPDSTSKSVVVPADVAVEARPSLSRRLLWTVLAAVPSSLMLSVTAYLSTDVAAVPLMWIVPLVLYLLTYIFVFARRQVIPLLVGARATAIVVIPLVIVIASGASQPIVFLIPLHLLTFFLITLVCHGQLAADRPASQHLTEFYLWMSLGGVVGGAFNALLSPLLFTTVAEYPITLVLGCLLAVRPLSKASSNNKETQNDADATLSPGRNHDKNRNPLRDRVLDWVFSISLGLLMYALIIGLQSRLEAGPIVTGLLFGIPALLCYAFSRRPLRFALGIGAVLLAGTGYLNGDTNVLYADRSFFGVHRVTLDGSGRFHQIVHGSTLHGSQLWKPTPQRDPLSYYFRTGPLGQIFKSVEERSQKWKIAVMGLGAGSVASYAQPQQDWTFYEIDPLVEKIARNPQYFTYLRDCRAPLQVKLGDGRLTLGREPQSAFNLLILDAYSSDSLPIHLMTREAMQLYLSKLAPKGMMIFHISNRHLDLAPVLGNLARDAGLACLQHFDRKVSSQEGKQGKAPAHYVIVARNQDDFGSLATDRRWQPCPKKEGLGVWTDDFASIFSAFQGR